MNAVRMNNNGISTTPETNFRSSVQDSDKGIIASLRNTLEKIIQKIAIFFKDLKEALSRLFSFSNHSKSNPFKTRNPGAVDGQDNGMEIAIFGVCGYVGLVTAGCFANENHITHVRGIDINEERIAQLNAGKMPFFEPGLDELVNNNLKKKKITFTTNPGLTKNIKVCFITVDTPGSDNKAPNLTNLKKVAKTIANELVASCLIVIKSTVPPGTTEKIGKKINKRLVQLNKPFKVEMANNPEFLSQGSAIKDSQDPDRIIIGVKSEEAEKTMRSIYGHLEDRLILMKFASSELTKYAANGRLATQISFINELALLCEVFGADVEEVAKGMGSDSRIGPHFNKPGAGYGGSCFPKDVDALIYFSRKNQLASPLIRAIQEANENQKKVIGQKLRSYFADKGGIENKTIAILGLSFKGGTSDMRGAPSKELIEELLNSNAKLQLCDPEAVNSAKMVIRENENISWHTSADEFGHGADAVVLITDWPQFKNINLSLLLKRMRGNAFFDGRNFLSPNEVSKAGFDYFGIGRQPVKAEVYEEPN